MFFPQCGKVLVIDDQIAEAMPLIKILGKRGVPVMYYSGDPSEFPDNPFHEIRLIFCDLKFNVASDPKSVASNVFSILKALVASDNGPFILLTWSAHSTDYLSELRNTFEKEKLRPEFILELSKSDFFKTEDNNAQIDRIIERISSLNLDATDEINVTKLLEQETLSLRTIRKVPREDAIENIEQKLSEELKQANLFHLFILWENTVGSSAIQTVNNIYYEIPDTIPNDKKLRAMLFYLAHYKLEKQINDADENIKFEAAISTLSELFSYFFLENVHRLSAEQIELGSIQNLKELKGLSAAKFNQWKMIAPSSNIQLPGDVYEDPEKHFQYHGLIVPKISTDKERYNTIVSELENDLDIKYILIDLSSECDIAQQKIFISRVVPGIIIPEDSLIRYREDKKIKSNGEPDYIFKLPSVEFCGKVCYILFNVNLMFPLEMDKLCDYHKEFTLTQSYVSSLKQKAAQCVSKQGIGFFQT